MPEPAADRLFEEGTSIKDGTGVTMSPALILETGGASKASGEAAKPARRRKRTRGKRSQAAGDAPAPPAGKRPRAAQRPARKTPPEETLYGALDLGTNNCRLLIARRSRGGFTVVDAFSRIVRLGEGLGATGSLSEPAMERAVAALKICSDKLSRRGVKRVRAVGTEACRAAGNGADFTARVKRETGIELDVVSAEDEARLALQGCAPLLDTACHSALVFDIGGGSTELMWIEMGGTSKRSRLVDWVSLPLGVVTLAERYGGTSVSAGDFEAMVAESLDLIAPFAERRPMGGASPSEFHLLGTSGTVTTITGVHLGLERYERQKVDGAWIQVTDVAGVTATLLEMTNEERAAHPCVGVERADLVLAGCAILQAIAETWPANRLRVADRGLREGILLSLMAKDDARRRRRRPRRRGGRRKSGAPKTAGGES